MKRRLLLIGIPLLLIILLAIPKVLPLLKSSGGAKSSAAEKVPKASVQAIIIRPTVLKNTIRATGTLLPGDEVELHCEVSGIITHLAIQEGKAVKKGDVLLKLNDAELQAQLKRVLSRKKLAEEQEYRQRKLLEIKGISQNEYDIALNELNSISSELELIRAQISRTEIRAPFNGVIGLKYISDGAYINPSSRIANLINLSTLKLDFAIPGQYASLLKSGDIISFSIQGSPENHTARIYALEPKIDPTTRTIQVRALCANTGKLFPGAFAEIELVLKDIPGALVIPTEALIPEIKGQRVFISHNGIAKAVTVETGIRTERTLQVIEGLNIGDTVITTGLLQIRPGSPINVTVLDSIGE